MPTNAIVYELGLTIVALVVFVVWQSVTLKRDMRRTKEQEEARAKEAAQEGVPPDDPPPAA